MTRSITLMDGRVLRGSARTPAELADFLEEYNPPKARQLMRRSGTDCRCALGWAAELQNTHELPNPGSPFWTHVGDAWDLVTRANDRSRGWGRVIDVLRSLTPEGRVKK